ncbi:U3 small nucleolar ribonucleoprotein imp3 [Coemansia sp. RSA 678]|nr:U3 small nucleolar ribonucleoprotein imp3 [Coemansia sp. RSA 678]
MVCQLKYHEKKLLQKVNFIEWKEYHKYSALVRQAQKLAHAISRLDPRDSKRLGSEKALLEKLRRLAVIMCRLKMAQCVSEAVRLIEQGHVRVGPDTVTDSAFLVTRNMEDFVTWVDTSKIKRKILKYNDKLDGFDLL